MFLQLDVPNVIEIVMRIETFVIKDSRAAKCKDRESEVSTDIIIMESWHHGITCTCSGDGATD